jgi:hypothetical protein
LIVNVPGGRCRTAFRPSTDQGTIPRYNGHSLGRAGRRVIGRSGALMAPHRDRSQCPLPHLASAHFRLFIRDGRVALNSTFPESIRQACWKGAYETPGPAVLRTNWSAMFLIVVDTRARMARSSITPAKGALGYRWHTM